MKSTLKIYLPNTTNQLQDPTPHLLSYQSLCHHPSSNFFETPPKRVSSTYHPSTFDHTLCHLLLPVFEVHPDIPCRQDCLHEK